MRSRAHPPLVRAVALVLAHAASALAQQPRPAQVVPPPLARRQGPVIETATLQLLATPVGTSNATLVVTFGDTTGVGAAPPRTGVSLMIEGTRRTFRDDGTNGDARAGDGQFSARLTVNRDSVEAERSRLLRSARADVRPALFVERVFVGRATVDSSTRAFTTMQAAVAAARSAARARQFLIPLDRQVRPGSLIPLPLVSAVAASDVDVARSLIITHPSVIGDPARTFDPCTNSGAVDGAWSFKHAMAGLANTPVTGIPLSHFTRRWLQRWAVTQVINDSPSNPRAGVTAFLNKWLAASGGAELNMDRAPFRLLAIINRTDLRDNFAYGGGSAGEGRLVFGAVDPADPCSPELFTVIFEYGIDKSSCRDARTWGQQWHDLRLHALGTAGYNEALAKITEQFVAAGSDPTQSPNRSALNQLRTNEVLDSPWQLREFTLARDDGDAGHLRQVTVKQNPIPGLDRTPTVAQYINAHGPAIVAGKHVVPGSFPIPPGAPFLGAESRAEAGFWDGPAPTPSTSITLADSRFSFSLNTCNGCHMDETSTSFTHIKPEATPGSAAALSAFMRGPITVNDPAGERMPDGSTRRRTFDEPLRRQQSLADLVGQSCLRQLTFRPLRAVH